MSKKVFGYCRVSTAGQVIDGESLDVQETKIKEYAKMKNLEIVSIHKEQGISGSVGPRQRPQLSYILSALDINKDGVSGLVVSKIDRLSRSSKDFINLMSEFQSKNIDVYFLNPDIDGSSTMGKFMLNLMSILANLEVDMIRDRTKEVMQVMKAQGKRVGSIPFGKRLIPNSNILEDEPEEMETIKIIKDLRKRLNEVVGKNNVKRLKPLTYIVICKDLEKQGRKNKDGMVRWFPTQIRRILYGTYKSGRTKNKKN